jgi:hypothetical protein
MRGRKEIQKKKMRLKKFHLKADVLNSPFPFLQTGNSIRTTYL